MAFFSTIESPLTVFEPVYAQRGLQAILLVALLAGAVGSLVVLRDLPFYTHAVGTGAYPFLVLAVAMGIALPIGALVGAAAFALVITAITRRVDDAGRRDALTGMTIVFALAAGSVLAATAVASDPKLALAPEALLFGSVLTVDGDVLITAALVAALVLPVAALFSGRWLAAGFDPQLSSQLGARRFDWLLLAAVALAAAATLPITGSLLAGALLVIPAATARIVFDRFASLAPATFLLALTEGVLGLYLAITLDLPTGASIAAVAGCGFLVAALGRLAFARRARSRGPRLRIASALIVVSAVATGATGCGSGSSTQSDAKADAVKVVVTTPQVADIVSSVGGEAITVETLMPVGTDPHDFEPKPSDVAKLADADAIIRSGGAIDEWVVSAAKTSGTTAIPVNLANSTKLIPTGGSAHEEGETEEEHGEHDDEFNAHWYLSPTNVQSATRKVRDELVKAAPSARESTRANSDAFLAEMEELDAALTKCVAEVPTAKRVFVSGHDDFAYLADSFGFEVASQIAPTGQSEPSARQLQTAVDAARTADARAVVVSAGESTQLTERFAEQLDLPLLELNSDSLAESGLASTLPGAIKYNVGRLADALSNGQVDCGAET